MAKERKIGSSYGRYGRATISKQEHLVSRADYIVRDDSGKIRSQSKDAGYAKEKADKVAGKK